MKRVKDDDKNMGPLFPRLHVNDTDRGGPRAPPRNMMALYEQLTIPTQRYNPGAVPLSSGNNGSLVRSSSTIQGTGPERNLCFPLYRSSLAPSCDELVRQPEGAGLSNKSEQADNRKKPREDDDFMVPFFSQPGFGPFDGKRQQSDRWERGNNLSPSHPTAPPSNGDEDTNQTGAGDRISRQHVTNQDGRKLLVSEAPTRYSDILVKGKESGRRREDNSVELGHQDHHRLGSLPKNNSCLRQDHEDSVPALDTINGEAASDRLLESPQKNIVSGGGCDYGNSIKVGNGMQRVRDDSSPEGRNVDRDDDVSETSMVDCISGLDVTPDDVVGVLGQRHFWKARTAILKQQRVFAVQVFELHRLIKVQRLIAESPNLMLEGSAFVGAATLKRSAVKQHSSEYAVKALVHTFRQKENSQKPTDRTEGTAENAVSKAAGPAPQPAIQPADHQQVHVNPGSFPPVNMDPKMNPWGFHQPSPHQWLVPVMSPSEGLVYKPFPAPGFLGPGCGGCGPVGPMPFGMQAPHYHQGMGVPPGIHFGGHGYFPPYGMPMMTPGMSGSAVDQTNPSNGQTSPMGNLRHQSSCNMRNHLDEAADTPNPRASPPGERDREVQGSTASSPSERQGARISALLEGRDALSLFPTAPTNETAEEAPPPTENPSRVIKVVPHNRKSTRESAARIFQSIQEERRFHESNN